MAFMLLKLVPKKHVDAVFINRSLFKIIGSVLTTSDFGLEYKSGKSNIDRVRLSIFTVPGVHVSILKSTRGTCK